MRKITIAALILFVFIKSWGQSGGTVSIIPLPASVQTTAGNFTLIKNASIVCASNDAATLRVAGFLSQKIALSTGYAITVRQGNSSSNNAGNISLTLVNDASLGNEGYTLVVKPNAVSISAGKPAGLFYGIQSLLQLLPKEIESNKKVTGITWNIPCVNIKDYPRFGWRAMMLDVSRHFFTKEEVKSFIDDMVRYKFNLVHLHLTDDQGWRIEIKSYPNLTKVGAWRPQRYGAWSNTDAPSPDEPKTYGGFYTQDDMKEIISYAQDRFVTILPEIDVPAHSMAAVAAYPELSCTPGTYAVNAGQEFQKWTPTGNEAMIDNTLCPANENVYVFLDKVFGELAQLFPYEYIHIGGDEAAKNFWAKSDAVKILMQKEGLKTQEEVQSYFVKRVEKIIALKGKKIIGWDEILEGGLAPGASVMSWRGMAGGIEAAKQGHHVVMSPMDYTYVDLMQGDAYVEPPEFSTLMLGQAYKFEPIPAGVDPKLILGGEGCLWSEHTTNMRAAGYLLWPRTMAISESVWTPAEKKSWPDFVSRVEHHFGRLDISKINYSRSMYNPVFTATTNNNGQLIVELKMEVPGIVAHYSFDETNPDAFYPVYEKPLSIPKDALHLKVITYRDGKPIGQQINMPVAELFKRAKTKKN